MTTAITEPGLYEIEAVDYHADPCPEPSLSNSIVRELIWPSAPRRAWAAHPRLNPHRIEDKSRRAELGSVAHELLLGNGRGLSIIEADSYRSKVAQEERDAAYAIGKTPVLVPALEQARAMVAAAEEQLRAFEDTSLFFDLVGHDARCKSEVAVIWQERYSGAWGRSLIDRLLLPQTEIWEVWDYKTTSRNVRPDAEGLGVHFTDSGYDTQAAMIERGLVAVYPKQAGRIRFRFLFQETEEPHLISVVEPDRATLEIGRRKCDEAFAIWAECLGTGEWPGYPQRVVPLRHADWLSSRWLAHEVEAAEAALAQGPHPPAPPKGRAKYKLKNTGGVPLPDGQTIIDGG